jgi:hypothetical protein
VTVRRHKGTSMVAAAALSNLLGSIVSIPFAHGIASVTATDLVIFAAFGFFQVALGLTLFVLGSAAVALRSGHPDRHAGNPADAVLGMARIPGDPGPAGAHRRRAGDGGCHR